MTLLAGGKPFPLEVGESEGRLRVSLSGKRLEFDLGGYRKGGLSIILAGRSYEAQVSLQNKHITVSVGGERYVFELDDGLETEPGARRRGRDDRAEVVAPMPGKVVKLLAKPGEHIQVDQGVLLFEAMKMQNEIRSPLAGKLVAIEVREGQAVESRDRLFTVKGVGN
jgi:biotin carboxyl carrier protein